MANSLDHAFFYKSENGDRVYDDASFEHWLKKFFTSGVFLNDLQVTANDDMTVTVGTGYVNADGKVKIFENETTLPVETAGASYPRIDSIVAERNDAERDITLKVVTGGYSSEPVAHIPVRQDGVYQLVIGQIYVSAGAVRITQANITDTRSDVDLCGFVASTVDQIDFSQVQTQFDSYFAQYKTQIASDYEEYGEDMEAYQSQLEADFETWFDSMKGQLSEDAAGNLQNQIDELKLTEGIELTQAEFDALPEAQKNKGTYYINDSDEGITLGEVHQKVEDVAASMAEQFSKLNSDLYPDTINITHDDGYFVGHVAFGVGLMIPMQIPQGYKVSVVTKIEIFTPNEGWLTVNYDTYNDGKANRFITCSGISVTDHWSGYPILCRMVATFTKK